MSTFDLIPLYKILCITLLLFVPLIPAYSLYKIAPTEKILAKGNFKGFKINASGAIAVFIILFVAIYSNIDGIVKSIDKNNIARNEIDSLNNQIQILENNRPWKLECKIKIIGDNQQDASYSEYENCLNPTSIQAAPMPVTINSNTKIVSFYVDDDVLKQYDNNYTIILPGGYGSKNLKIDDRLKNRQTRSIFLQAEFKKNSSAIALRGNEEVLPAVHKGEGLSKPPSVQQ